MRAVNVVGQAQVSQLDSLDPGKDRLGGLQPELLRKCYYRS